MEPLGDGWWWSMWFVMPTGGLHRAVVQADIEVRTNQVDLIWDAGRWDVGVGWHGVRAEEVHDRCALHLVQ
eukprot:7676375-Alexandrium_andersonii.AAC.1